jgi:hypothetical protein
MCIESLCSLAAPRSDFGIFRSGEFRQRFEGNVESFDEMMYQTHPFGCGGFHELLLGDLTFDWGRKP